MISIPMQVTADEPFECTAEPTGRNIIRGRPISRRMMRYLSNSLSGSAREERLDQMREINAPVYLTYQMRERGMTAAQIADAQGIRKTAVYDRLQRAELFMRGTLAPANDAERLRNLEIADPRAHTVCILRDFGWSQAAIADQLGCSVSAVAEAAVRARTALGPNFDSRLLWQYRAMVIVAQSGKKAI